MKVLFLIIQDIINLQTAQNQIETILEGASGVRLDNFDNHWLN